MEHLYSRTDAEAFSTLENKVAHIWHHAFRLQVWVEGAKAKVGPMSVETLVKHPTYQGLNAKVEGGDGRSRRRNGKCEFPPSTVTTSHRHHILTSAIAASVSQRRALRVTLT